ncbi:MAG: hypothetical protein HY777_12530 [Betaproteobacteria bacterium]|nr:hypothetical protein [Betaproteobacteria bacterium]
MALLLAAPAEAGRLYCCADDQGKQVCGDLLPPVCRDRAYREIGNSGQTVRRVDAPLTAEQTAQRETEAARRKEQEAALKEQQRKDRALLATYGNEKDIETVYNRSVQETVQAIKAAEDKIADIRKRRKTFENEAEFYKKRTLPVEVEKGLRDADTEVKTQESLIGVKKKDLESLRARYEDDLRRYSELTKRSR